MLDIKLNTNLIDIYYKSILEKKWNKSTIKNKLAYFKRKGKYDDHLALHCANKKVQTERELNKESTSV